MRGGGWEVESGDCCDWFRHLCVSWN